MTIAEAYPRAARLIQVFEAGLLCEPGTEPFAELRKYFRNGAPADGLLRGAKAALAIMTRSQGPPPGITAPDWEEIRQEVHTDDFRRYFMAKLGLM